MRGIFAQMQGQIGIREHRSIYQFDKPTTKLRIENVFNVVGALTHKRVKLLSQQIPFINTTTTRLAFARNS